MYIYAHKKSPHYSIKYERSCITHLSVKLKTQFE